MHKPLLAKLFYIYSRYNRFARINKDYMRINWIISDKNINYDYAVKRMENIVEGIISDKEQECIWMLEHDPIYTAGSSTNTNEILQPQTLPIYKTGRGGKCTYHGPGQRVVYFMLDLKKRFAPVDPDLKRYVWLLEQLIIDTLSEFGIQSRRIPNLVGIWVNTTRGTKKIAAIGIRVRKWVTYHGIAINICPNLLHFDGIIPCGLKNYGVTSMKNLGHNISLELFDRAFIKNCKLMINDMNYYKCH